MSTLKVDTIQHTGGTTGLTINSGGVVLQPTKPVFRVNRSADQSIANDTVTVIQFDVKTGNNNFDIGGYFNTSTYRYLPLVAGYYSFSMGVLLEDDMYVIGNIRKNGQVEFQNRAWTESGLYSTAQVNGVIYLNGSTDYVDGVVYHYESGGGSKNIRGEDGDRSATYLCGFLIG